MNRQLFEPMLAVISMQTTGGAEPSIAGRVPSDVPIFDLGAARVRDALAGLVRLIRRLKPHVVMSTLDHLNIAIGFTRPFWPRSTRWVLRMTSILSFDVPHWSRLMKLSFQAADGVILQSTAMAEAFDRRVGTRGPRRFMIPNPLNLDEIAARAAGARAPRSDGFRLAAVGRLDPVKQYDLLIAAMAQLAPHVTLTLVGGGGEQAKLAAQIEALGLHDRVLLAGWNDNPYAVMAASDALVMCSRMEGFPNVVIEALACGTPVIATPVPGMHELLDPIAGCVVAKSTGLSDLVAALETATSRSPVRIDPELVRSFDVRRITPLYESAFASVSHPGGVAMRAAA